MPNYIIRIRCYTSIRHVVRRNYYNIIDYFCVALIAIYNIISCIDANRLIFIPNYLVI